MKYIIGFIGGVLSNYYVLTLAYGDFEKAPRDMVFIGVVIFTLFFQAIGIVVFKNSPPRA